MEKKGTNERAVDSYIYKNANKNTRMQSRSGAIFVAISDWILSKNGVIYGCVIDGNNEVLHVRAETAKARDEMRKSKYCQSNMTDVLKQIKDDLLNGRHVLFSGTGCQVQGVINYLEIQKISRDLLWTIDIVCHGVPSPKLFKEFIGYTQSKYNGQVKQFEFRDKTVHGWDDYIETYVIDGKKYKSTVWRQLFNSDYALRPSCYECRFSNLNRKSDFTIADAWGVKHSDPDFNDNRGVSLVILNSDRSKAIFNQIVSVEEYKKVPIKSYMQKNLKSSTVKRPGREKFWDTYYARGISGLIETYTKIPLSKRVKSGIKYMIRKVIFHNKYYLP